MRLFNKDIHLNDLIPPIILRTKNFILKKLKIKQTSEIEFPRVCDKVLNSFSQYNEDLILDTILGFKSDGLYVDIGANHPIELSNTYRFYKKGWCGINIEPTPHLHEKLSNTRNRDINLNTGVHSKHGLIDFYQLQESTLSTFSKKAAIFNIKRYRTKLEAVLKINVKPLSDILNTHLDNRHIDFMTVDVEGLDLEVLKSNNWEMYRPSILLIELNIDGNEIADFLHSQNYKLIFSNGLNGIFSDNTYYKQITNDNPQD